MSIAAGTRLGSYEVVAQIGAGGMGEVYQAHDTKLGRDVAIKVLPEAFAHDADRLSRFQREAKMLAALNHPNIATIFGLEHFDGTHYLVMELVPGDTLQQRVKRDGAVPVEEALTIAKQIAEALEAAHEKSIIHRDLKPANVKVTSEGKVKVLDFGLAKAFAGDTSTQDIGNSPTLSQAATMQGVILGTAAYMSPEQAKGKQVDKRTDIWAFGCVLFELLTGKQAFTGEDITEILAAVVMKEPAFDALPANISPSIRVLLQRCLRKDRRHRLPDAGAVRIDIEDAIAAPKNSGATQAAPAATRKLLAAAAAVLAITVIVVLGGWWRATRPAELKPLVRLDLELDPPASTVVGSGPILSPDGARMVYVGQGRLYTRRLDQADTTEIKGTEGASGPFFSPDGQWVGFYSQGRMKKASITGGGVVTLSGEVGTLGLGGTWGEDGNIIFTKGTGLTPLVRIPAAGGKAEPIGKMNREQGEAAQAWPQILPGGKLLLYTGRALVGQADDGFTVALSLSDLGRKIVQRNAAMGRYAALPDGSGYLLYANGGKLFAAPFDLKHQETHGTATPVVEDVLEYTSLTGAQFDVSANGTLVYQRGKSAGGAYTLQWVDSAGKLQPLLMKPGPYGRPKISPDGNRLALDNAADVWTYDWQRDIMTRLTFNGGIGALWSPDSRFILYSGADGMNWTRSDGGTAPQTLIASQNPLYPWSFSPDGKRLAYLEVTGGGYDLFTVAIQNDGTTLKAGTPEPLLKNPADERYPSFSPDGRWMMYTSNESGTFQVYVRAFPDKGGKWQISSDGGTYPNWSSDRRTIFFRTLDNHIMVVNYTAKGDTFTAEKPRLWMDQSIAEVGTARNYDLHPDGKRIVALLPAGSSGESKDATHVTILFNFFDELHRRTATQAK